MKVLLNHSTNFVKYSTNGRGHQHSTEKEKQGSGIFLQASGSQGPKGLYFLAINHHRSLPEFLFWVVGAADFQEGANKGCRGTVWLGRTMGL